MSYVSVSPGLGAIDVASRSLAQAPTAPIRTTLPVRLPTRSPVVSRGPVTLVPRSPLPTVPAAVDRDVQLPVGPPEAERREKEKRQRMMLLGGIALAGVVAFLLMRRK
jgi:hypothetical protein